MKTSSKELTEQLQDRKSYLEKILENVTMRKKSFKTNINGKIRVEKKRNSFQYYLRSNTSDTNGKYIGKENEKQVREFLQNEYDEKIIKVISNEISMINKYIGKNTPEKIQNTYSTLSEGRKRIISPVEEDDETFVKKWLAVEYEGKEFYNNTTEFYTQKGERVRSKSEVIIADLLYKYQIPYRYEFPVKLKNKITYYPDFTILNVKKRKEIYLEHLGMLDNSEYLEKAINKLNTYTLNNIVLGDNLLITYETRNTTLNIPVVNKIILENCC